MPFQWQPELQGDDDPAGPPQDWDDIDAELALQIQYEQEAEENQYPAYADHAAGPSDTSDGVFIASKKKKQTAQKTEQNGKKHTTNVPPPHDNAKMTGTTGKGKGKAREPIDLSEYEDELDEEDMIFDAPQNDPPTSNTSNDYDDQIVAYTQEISSIDREIQELKDARIALQKKRDDLMARQAQARRTVSSITSAKTTITATSKSKKTVDYSDSSQFTWTKKLQATLSNVFGIKKLRLCQEGVLNAVLDGRDVICIMPTGGGKSVCFQAPAVLTPGCTLVISPLLSLMADQVMHLREKGVEAVMITGTTEHAEIKDITRRMLLRNEQGGEKPIKLCYVTPEKMAKSKTFINTLSKMNEVGLLARIAIDESHCCSQMGHDFRPDYKRLSTLKQLFPSVPIIALTATCGRAVLNDVVRILRLQQCTAGEEAEPGKTVFFSAPLYRQNLHYSIRSKPSSAPAVIQEMADEIMAKHAGHTGIVYCLSQKDTMTVAEGLQVASGGKIKTGTYHAGMSDSQKQAIHEKWRSGRVKCVVATIAFGLGIDAPDVRYVYHHCISKSMEGYYQETGRAGRDGKDSDCVLWFRPADASRLSTLGLAEVDSTQKLYSMLSFAIDYTTCRKLLFDKYFGNPASVVAPFTSSDQSACGHCDNCLRSTSTEKDVITVRDVTLDAWKICKVFKAVDEKKGRVTLPQAGDLVRGLGKGRFKLEGNSEGSVDLQELCGGKVEVNKDDAELLLLQLLMDGYLQELFVQTAYTVISYIKPGSGATRLTRWKEDQLAACGLKIELTTLGPVKPKRGSKKKKEKEDNDEEQEPPKKTRKKNNAKDIAGLPPTDTTASRIAHLRAARSSSPKIEECNGDSERDSDDEDMDDSRRAESSKGRAGDRSIIEID